MLIIFSIVWFFVWWWFFKAGKSPTESFIKNGLKAFANVDYKKAKELLSKADNLTPDAQYKLGMAHLALGEYAEAQACFEAVLKTSPKNFDALVSLSQTLQFQGKNDEALEIYTKALIENDKNIDCYLSIGRLYQEQGNYEKALEIFNKAKEIAPENIQVLFSIVKCKSELCDPDNEDDYQKLIDECIKLAGSEGLPSDYDTSLAKVYAKGGDIDKALESCKRAVELNEKDVEAYRLLGLIQLIKRDLDGAKNSLSMALNFQQNDSETHNVFSYLLCLQVDDCTMKKCRDKYFSLVKKHIK